MRKQILFFCLLTGGFLFGRAQEPAAESIPLILKSLSTAPADTNTARLKLRLGLLYVHKAGEYATDLDSALLLVKEAIQLNEKSQTVYIRAEAFYVMAQALREKGDTAQAHSAIKRCIEYFKLLPSGAELGEAYLEEANYYDLRRPGLLCRKECMEQALVQLKLAGSPKRQADVLKDLGDYNQLLRNYGEAMINLQQALALYEKAGHNALQGVYDLLGIVSTNIGDYANAIKYGLLAAQTAERLNDTSMQLCTVYNRLGVAYGNWNRRDEAMVYLIKAVNIAMKYHDRDATESVLLNICYMQQGQPGWEKTLQLLKQAEAGIGQRTIEDSLYWNVFYNEIYLEGRKYQEADVYANMLIRQLPDYKKSGVNLQAAYSCLARYFIAKHRADPAQEYASDDLDYTLRNMNKKSIVTAYLLKSAADSLQGHFLTALQDFQMGKRIYDSMINEAKNFQFAQMQVIHETEKKDHDIEMKGKNIELLTNKNMLQEVSLKKANMTRNIIIIAALLLSALFYTGYEFKKRSNARLRVHQEEIKLQNEQLRVLLSAQKKLLEEKEWLVREIHHRVKNNLQVVISLLNTQSEYLDSPSAIRAIRESRERMQAIAIIHQKLYQGENNTVINMPSYIEEMVSFLSTSLTDTWRVRMELDIEDINLDISQAVPLGLMLNEAITNAIKYAFPEDKMGTLSISLSNMSGDRISLKIKDNGPGLPANFNPNANNSLGMQLMRLFSEQLEGDLLFSCNQGVQISLVFRQYGGESKPMATTA